jgi:hypothetical protein
LVTVGVVASLVVLWWTISTVRTTGWFALRSELAWRFTPLWAALLAAVILVVTLVCVHWAMRLSKAAPEKPRAKELDRLSPADRAARITAFRRSGLKGLVVGGDGRASTSQLQAEIWTLALVFGLLFLLLVGRTPNCPAAAARPHLGSCPGSAMTGVSFADLLGSQFRWEYLLLLGWPVAVAVTARHQVLSALDQLDAASGANDDPNAAKAGSADAAGSGTAAEVKTPPTDASAVGILSGLREIVGDDQGRGALLDAQYFAFTLVTVAYFLLELLTAPTSGLPAVPAALLVLMGISGSGYLSAKVLDPIGVRGNRDSTPPPPPVTPATGAPEPTPTPADPEPATGGNADIQPDGSDPGRGRDTVTAGNRD